MDDQRHKCSCLGWDPGPLLSKAHPGAKACGPNKKKSRKHQRFMARRELEQRALLRSGEKSLKVMMEPSETCTVQDSEPRKASQCSWSMEEKEIVKTHRSTFGPSATVGTVKQSSSSQDRHPKVTLPSGSSTCTDPLSCLSLKKPRKCVAIDCEMVGTGPVGKISELARCTVVNYDGEVIYDKYILPVLPILDYRTRWSGVTRQHMKRATPFRVARREILQILRNKIVVGHAIHNDFLALKYFHPREWTRDTSKSPLLKEKVGLPIKTNVSLKSLARELLHKEIQGSKNGHCSVEDARTSMELYRLVEIQWEQELASSLPSSPPDSGTDINHYMDDQYWPKDLDES
ncbi:hypothetical protein lerEdw1_011030 [Lerista edwardsae]|nr:hypothetical protein lerEdw1_011030 [Lerista edwardsae]